jgi:hypothetical protein
MNRFASVNRTVACALGLVMTCLVVAGPLERECFDSGGRVEVVEGDDGVMEVEELVALIQGPVVPGTIVMSTIVMLMHKRIICSPDSHSPNLIFRRPTRSEVRSPTVKGCHTQTTSVHH